MCQVRAERACLYIATVEGNRRSTTLDSRVIEEKKGGLPFRYGTRRESRCGRSRTDMSGACEGGDSRTQRRPSSRAAVDSTLSAGSRRPESRHSTM